MLFYFTVKSNICDPCNQPSTIQGILENFNMSDFGKNLYPCYYEICWPIPTFKSIFKIYCMILV